MSLLLPDPNFPGRTQNIRVVQGALWARPSQRPRSRWIQAPATLVFTPRVYKALQKPAQRWVGPNRSSSRVLPAPPFNAGGVTPPSVYRAIQKPPRPTRNFSTWTVAPPYNAGGIQGIVLKATQKPRPTRVPAVVITPAYNG